MQKSRIGYYNTDFSLLDALQRGQARRVQRAVSRALARHLPATIYAPAGKFHRFASTSSSISISRAVQLWVFRIAREDLTKGERSSCHKGGFSAVKPQVRGAIGKPPY